MASCDREGRVYVETATRKLSVLGSDNDQLVRVLNQLLGLVMDTSPLPRFSRRQSAIRPASSCVAVSSSLIAKCVEGRFADSIDCSMSGSSKQCPMAAPSLAPSTDTCQRSDVPGLMLDSPAAVPQLPRTRGKTNQPVQRLVLHFIHDPFPKLPVWPEHTPNPQVPMVPSAKP